MFIENPSLKHRFFLRLAVIGVFFITVILLISFNSSEKNDPLPSWREGDLKKGIIGFVKKVTTKGESDFIKEEDRIAVFDNDGTLWQEQPVVEGVFVMSYLKSLSKKDPTLKTKQPYKAALEGDMEYLKKGGPKTIMELIALTHANKSQETFNREVSTFLDTARHPKLKKPYTQLAYQPMLELINYLRANKFQVWICSGGSIEFMRNFSEKVYGVVPQQVIGSELKLNFIEKDNEWVLWRSDTIIAFNDKNQKPVDISNHIGKIPVFTVGNERSGGDIFMLTYSQQRKGASFQMIINHNDAMREFEYHEKDSSSIKTAQKNGWKIVDMKKDWIKVFPFN